MNDRQNRRSRSFRFARRPLADLIKRVKAGDFETSKAREIFAAMARERPMRPTSDEPPRASARWTNSELVALCERLLAANPKIVADVASGKAQAAAGLIGQAKKRNPNVNPPARVKGDLLWS